MLFWVVLSLFCGILCTLIAHWRKRNYIMWFIDGLIFGPFAVIAILLIGGRKDVKSIG